MMTNRLILLDRNLRDLRVVEASARRAGFEVGAFETTEDAWTALEAEPFDLLIAADEPPQLDAFAFSQRVKAHPSLTELPILLLVPNLDRSRRLQAIQAGAEDALGKPSSTAEILGRANALCRRQTRDRLMAATSLVPGADSGSLEDVPPADLVGILESWGRSGVLHLRTDEGIEGVVYVRHGKPVDAEVGPIAGMPALARVLGWEHGTFRIDLKTVRRPDVLERSTGDLLAAGLDLANAPDASAIGGLDPRAILEVDAAVLARMAAGLSAELNGLIRLCDGKRNVRAVVDASALPNPEAMKALTACEHQGILRRVLLPPAAVPAGETVATLENEDDDPIGAPDEDEPNAAAVAMEDHPEELTAHEIGENDLLAEASPPLSVGAPSPLSPEAPSSLFSPSFPDPSALPPPLSVVPPPPPPPANLPEPPDWSSPGPSVSAPFVSDPVADFPLPGNETLPLGLAGPSVPPAPVSVLATGAEATTEPPSEAGDSTGDLSSRAPQVVEPAAQEPRVPDSHADDKLAVSAEGGSVDPDASAIAAFFPEPRESGKAGFASAAEPAPPSSSPPQPSSAPSWAPASAGAPQDIGEEFTADEALEELGLYGRGRRLRWRAAALALTGVLAFGAHRWFAGQHAAAVMSRSAPALTANAAPQTGHAAEPKPERTEPQGPAVTASSTSQSTPPAPTAGAAPGGPENSGHPAAPRPDPSPATPASVALVGAEGTRKAEEPDPDSATRGGPADRLAKFVQAKGVGDERPGAAFARAVSECRAALEQHRRHHSVTACGEALASNPASPEAMTLLAHAEMNRGHMDRAQELAAKAAAIDPRLADAYVILGGALQDSGRDHDAKVAYRKYLQLAPHGRYADELRSIVRTM